MSAPPMQGNYNTQYSDMSKPPMAPPPYPAAQTTPYPTGPPPAQAPGYYSGGVPPPQPAQPTIIIQGNVINSHNPVSMMCPKCHAQITTSVQLDTGLTVWVAVAAICFFGGGMGCCLIPFFIDALKDATHKCPNCNMIIGIHKQM